MSDKRTIRFLAGGIAVILVAAFGIVATNYAGLPELIPVHYNHKGLVDGYGSKNYLWMLPLIASLMCYGIIKSNKWLPKLNPNLSTKELFIITWGSHLLSFLIAVSFSYITIQTIFIAREGSGGLGVWFLPVFAIGMIVLPILPLFWYKRKE